MAQKKAKPAPVAQKVSTPAATRAARPPTTAATGGTDPNRLLREAAWSRMFGRVEAKNPFTR